MTRNQTDEMQVEQAVRKYIEGLNQSDVDALLPLFTPDGVLMAVDAPTIVGSEQLRIFFSQGLSAIKLDAKIEFDEVVVTGNYAYARTHSQVTVTVLQTNSAQPEQNRELFLLTKDSGEWRISRYMFNKLPAL